MSVIEYDVVIIGAGLAGLTAGTHLASRGLRVCLVAKGDPTACLSTGCIDFCTGEFPLESMASLPDGHPLRKISADDFMESQNYFLQTMTQKGLPYAGSIATNRLVLTAMGTHKTTCLVPGTMQASPQNVNDAIHIITFKGLKDFYPSYISACRPASFSTYDAGVSTTMGIAARFEQKEFLDDFLAWLMKQNIQESKIAFPAVLGMESTANIVGIIEKNTGRSVFEIPTLPPSMPGRRLFNALKDHFRSLGGQIYWNWPVTGVEKTGGVVEAVYTHSAGKPNSINARAFVLATGSFIGGGLYATREAIVEKVFNLPVWVPSAREGWFEEDYFSTDHDISKAGVIVDSAFRPENTPWKNIFVCGGILAHAQILKYGCGNGLSLSTGYAAAKACAGYLQ